MITHEINPDTLDGMFPRVQINEKFIAHETSFSILDDGKVKVSGLVLDWGVNVKTHRRAVDIVQDAIGGQKLQMRFVERGGVFGDRHEVEISDINVQEIDGDKWYHIEFTAI